MVQRTEFERCALVSGLLSEEQLDEARALVDRSGTATDEGRPLDEQIADTLVELEYVNAWQARQLLDGRTRFTLGPYSIVDSIGRGGMGQVFKGEHTVLGRIVAIKVLPRTRSTPDAILNFMREIRALARLDHEHLVRAYDAGHDGNVYYLVTEYVPGTDLRKLVRRTGPLSMEEAARIVYQVAVGLEHAHQQGLIHRDVKPGNVLVTPEGRAKLSDLGLAGPIAGDAASDLRFGKTVGTADYLSPEHIRDPHHPTPAWDIYSLGCTLYYAVTSKVPFPGGTTAEKARAHCELRPLDPRRLNTGLTAEFVDVLAAMMAKDPDDRIATAGEVAALLARWAAEPLTGPLGERTARRAAINALSFRLPPAGPAEAGLADTESSFPEVPDSPGESRDFPGESSQTTHSVAAAAEETLSRSDVPLPPAAPSHLNPLWVFLALPAAITAMILFLGWFIHALFP